ncbi:Enterobactin exporter EntS [subsurface metagenome]
MGLGPFLGVLADRYDRRRILMITRVASGACALALAALYYTSLLEVWHIFVLVLCGGAFRAIDFTTRYAVAPDTVKSHNLTSAVGLLDAGMGITRVAGSLAGGHLFKVIGVGGCFAVMAAFYLFSCLSLLPMHLVTSEKPTHQESVWESVLGGIRYVVNDRAMFALIVLAAIANLFAFPCVLGIMPVFARDVLYVGSDGLGWLLAANGLGRLIGALAISTLGRFRHKGWLLIGAMIAWPAFLGIFASLRLFYVNLALLVSVGIACGIAMVLIQLLLLAWASEEIRGRVSGMRIFAIAMLPLGNILSGAGATLWGASIMIVLNALACILTTMFIAFWAPQLRQRQ